jgi:Ca2+-binding EF-hand superfamily protein
MCLDEDEFEALVKFFDVNGDGDISWDEFKRALYYLNNPKMTSRLPPLVRNALRKV